jgi:hypothetical protein
VRGSMRYFEKFFLCPSKNEVALKILFDRNLIMINHKFNGDLKKHIILREAKSNTKETCSIT